MKNGTGRKFSYELIKDYLDGFLDEKTSAEVREYLANNDVGADIARGILLLEEKFKKDDEAIDGYLDNLLGKQQQLLTNNNRESVKRRTPLLVAAAVSLLALSTFALWLFDQPTSEEIVARELSQPYAAVTIVRAGGEDSNFEKAMLQYSAGDYAESIQLFEQALAAEENSTTAKFYMGLSFLYNNQPKQSATYLRHSVEPHNRFQEQARWFLTLAYLQSDQTHEAQQILKEILEQQTYKHEQARKLAAALED